MKTADEIRREEEAAEVEDFKDAIHTYRASARQQMVANMNTVTLELAHREALAEDNERDARDWSAFIVQVAARKADDVREQSDMDE